MICGGGGGCIGCGGISGVGVGPELTGKGPVEGVVGHFDAGGVPEIKSYIFCRGEGAKFFNPAK